MTALQQTSTKQQLEATFKKIQTERMAGVPVINKQLQVKATDFQKWQNNQLGILITPWFMNIILLPLSTDTTAEQDAVNEWDNINVGQEISHQFPSGRYTFVVGYEEQIGYYQSCSLFSPMFEFEDQKAAETTAQAALTALFDKDYEDVESQHPAEAITKIWTGEAPKPATDASFADTQGDELKTSLINSKSLEEKLQEPLSRRDFLRGRILDTQKENRDGTA